MDGSPIIDKPILIDYLQTLVGVIGFKVLPVCWCFAHLLSKDTYPLSL